MSSSVIAKKYAQALAAVCSEEELNVVTTYIKGVASLFSDSKFVDVVKSPLVTRDEKVSIIVDKLSDAPVKFVNFIKILSVADRLLVIPHIVEELFIISSAEHNTFSGFIESDTEFDSSKIEELKKALTNKLSVSLDLETRKNDYDGVKVEIPDMGLRIDFSQSHIKEQMLVHILKAI
jgi:F-type H+-transporting ATPase subunit delta